MRRAAIGRKSHASGRLAGDKLAIEERRGNFGGFVIKRLQDFVRGRLADGVSGLPQDGQRRIGDLRPWMIIEADDSDIVGASQTKLLQGPSMRPSSANCCR